MQAPRHLSGFHLKLSQPAGEAGKGGGDRRVQATSAPAAPHYACCETLSQGMCTLCLTGLFLKNHISSRPWLQRRGCTTGA